MEVNMKISEKGLDLIKNFEGCRLTAYKPVAAEQYYTIGWGHYGPDVKQGMTITQEQADKYLLEDIVGYETTVSTTCGYLPKLTQNEFDALVSFTYNCGSGNLLKLTGNKTRTKAQMMDHIGAYNRGADGKVLAGLTRRRAAEKALFLDQVNPNDEKLDYLGIRRFQRAGYKGQGITFVSKETLTEHGRKVLNIMKLVAPDADIYYGKNYTNDIDENTDIYTTSAFISSDKYTQNRMKAKELYDKGVFLCCAVGNEGEDIMNLAKDDWWTSVGACTLTKGKPTRLYYSGVSDKLDFMSMTNMTTDYGVFTGTSCASPMFAGMCALVQCFFKINTGKKLTNEKLLEFIKDNVEDLAEEGHDNKTGYGLFRLPAPEDIDISKYVEEEEEMRYQKVEEMPVWAQPTIKHLVKYGFLKGDENGNLDLSLDMIRMFMILERAGAFNVDPEPVWEPEDERPGSEK